MLAYRLGFRPGEWEHLEPGQLFAYRDGWAWARARELQALATAVFMVRGIITDKPDISTLARLLRAGVHADRASARTADRVAADLEEELVSQLHARLGGEEE